VVVIDAASLASTAATAFVIAIASLISVASNAVDKHVLLQQLLKHFRRPLLFFVLLKIYLKIKLKH